MKNVSYTEGYGFVDFNVALKLIERGYDMADLICRPQRYMVTSNNSRKEKTRLSEDCCKEVIGMYVILNTPYDSPREHSIINDILKREKQI